MDNKIEIQKEITLEISTELKLPPNSVKKVIELKLEGNTVPFIARYRKDVTGSLEDHEIRDIFKLHDYFVNLEERKVEILRIIEERGQLTQELIREIGNAKKLNVLEDIYRPFKNKKNTKGELAKKMGLEPLKDYMLNVSKEEQEENINAYINKFLKAETGTRTREEVLENALHIIKEEVIDNKKIRDTLRYMYLNLGILETQKKGKDTKEGDNIFEMYYDYKEPVRGVKNHRILAINRGVKKDILKYNIIIDQTEALSKIIRMGNIKDNYFRSMIEEAYGEALKKSLKKSIENEVFNKLFQEAGTSSMEIFKKNLRQLLLIAPVKDKVILGYDPGFRTGCKIGVIGTEGQMLHTDVIFPTEPRCDFENSKKKILKIIKDFKVDAIAIGNGTASRESEEFIAKVLSEVDNVEYTIVSEAGASVYSASEVAIREFPDMDVTKRSAISIGRRLQDPLSELVKIDSKSIGVGQYQHDVNQKELKESLDGVVEDCVNFVGVDLNTASVEILQYIAGFNRKIAEKIVDHRMEIGKYASRMELLNVKGLGPKAFKQGAGFLRIKDSKEILDNTMIHPESYELAKKIMNDPDYMDLAIQTTIMDIKRELAKPGAEPREELEKPVFKKNVVDIKDLKEGMIINGIVRNIVDFGAFVDIGVHADGLIHISKISNKFISSPFDVLEIGQVVKCKIIEIDEKKHKISLSMRDI